MHCDNGINVRISLDGYGSKIWKVSRQTSAVSNETIVAWHGKRRVTSYDLKDHKHGLKFKIESSNQRVASLNARVTSSNPRVTSSNL